MEHQNGNSASERLRERVVQEDGVHPNEALRQRFSSSQVLQHSPTGSDRMRLMRERWRMWNESLA